MLEHAAVLTTLTWMVSFSFRHIKQLLMTLQFLNLNYRWSKRGKLFEYLLEVNEIQLDSVASSLISSDFIELKRLPTPVLNA